MNAITQSIAVEEHGRVSLPVTPPEPQVPLNPARKAPLNGESHEQPRKPKGRSLMRPVVLGLLSILAVVVAAKFADHWWTVGRFIQSTDDAYIGGDVTVIAPEVAGFIQKIAVQDNQAVHAGDLLIQLDDRDYLAALAKAQASVSIQQAALTNLEATYQLQEAIVAQTQADIAAAAAQITLTHDDRIRYKNLVDNGTVSVQSYEDADTVYKQALASGEKAQAGLAAAQRQLDVILTQKQEVQATLQQAIAERDIARLNLGYTQLRAPIDGTVGNRSAQVGAYETAGSQLISLIPAHGLWVDANFKEDQLARMHSGMPASISVDEIPGKSFHGRVVSVAPATGAEFSVLPPENATGNFTKIVQRVTVRIAFDDEAAAPGELRPGLSATVKVDTRAEGKQGL